MVPGEHPWERDRPSCPRDCYDDSQALSFVAHRCGVGNDTPEEALVTMIPTAPITTEWLAIDASNRALQHACAKLRRGKLVAFPTETVYGLGADARNPQAVGRIFTAKGRPSHNPLIVHVASIPAACELTTAWNDQADMLAQAFWPGPLTLVLPRGAMIPEVVSAGGANVALRCPAHPIALELIERSGCPLAAPSANRSGAISPTTAEHVWLGLAGHIELILDAGPTSGGIESTVLDLTTLPPRLLRPGLIALATLERVIGHIEVGREQGSAKPLPSPGLLHRHYAPQTPLELLPNPGLANQRLQALQRRGLRVGWLSREGELDPPPVPPTEVQHLPRDVAGYSRLLYAALHRLDAAGIDVIVAVMPPSLPEWQGVQDRLRRAAHTP